MNLYIGTSGWSYDHWQNIVYPFGTKGKERLDYYLKLFRTVELNSSFYHWPNDNVFKGWYRRLPENFILTVKAPRNLTHYQKLYKPEGWIEVIFRAIGHLQEKMGVLLVQLPPSLGIDIPRLDYFLKVVPTHVKMTLEFRNHSWHDEETYHILEKYNKAYCIMSGACLPCVLKATTNFVYIRLHGSDQPNSGGCYSEENLHWWAQRIKEWMWMKKDVYAYFNNDYDGHAVRNALRLIEIIKN